MDGYTSAGAGGISIVVPFRSSVQQNVLNSQKKQAFVKSPERKFISLTGREDSQSREQGIEMVDYMGQLLKAVDISDSGINESNLSRIDSKEGASTRLVHAETPKINTNK